MSPVKSFASRAHETRNPVLSAQNRKREELAALGLCGPDAYKLSRAGFSGDRTVCPDCEAALAAVSDDNG
jgi:hypothetical protein